MNKRIYHIFFDLHSVSGIIISVLLYIIFFAGSFALFKNEIQVWQEGGEIVKTSIKDINFDKLLQSLDKTYPLHGRDISFNFNGNNRMYVYMSGCKEKLAPESQKQVHYFYLDSHNAKTQSYEQQYSLGEFLYRLHFLDQIPYPIGRYTAGGVAVFFLFAIITGLILHWNRIKNSFYTFNPNAALRRLWADAHTSLGFIGLPFQFIYSITGAYFTLSLLVLLPASLLYKGNQAKLMADMRSDREVYEWKEKSDDNALNFNYFVKKTSVYWSDFNIENLYIKNYGGTNMKYVFSGKSIEKKRFAGVGNLTFNAYTGIIESKNSPLELNYIEDSQQVLKHLHFADYGNISVKIIYFILSFITCFIIVSGVLVWGEARNKKSKSQKQRMYVAKVVHIFLSICLSMLPITALSFSFVRITEGVFIEKKIAIYYFYFSSWILLFLFFRFKRNNYFTNKISLLLSSLFGFLVPFTNGLTSGNWFWVSFKNKQYEILLIDVLWIILSTTALIFYLKINPQSNLKNRSPYKK